MKSAAIVAAALALSATVMPAEPLPIAKPSGPPQGAQEAMSNGTCAVEFHRSGPPFAAPPLRVPVVRDGKLVGIVTRANLLHALASVIAEAKPGLTSDAAIRERVYAKLKAQRWAPVINVVVRNGIVHLSGTLLDERQRGAIRAAAENISRVKAVEDHLVWIDPVSGIAIHAF